MEKYFAEFRYGKPSLARATVTKETEKTFAIEGFETIIGWWYANKRVDKGKYFYSDTMLEALVYLKEQASEYVEAQRAEVARAQEQVDMLSDMVFKLKYEKGA